tara:strand:+ start:282 stop:1220 length:939 start_codon:yes stop_codon:yes gene_type:complete
MNLEPSNQLKLFGHKENFNHLANLFNKETFPSKIILSGPDGIGKSTFAYHFINFVLSSDEIDAYDIKNNEIISKNKSFNLLNNNTHPNFFSVDLVEEKKNIEISQIRSMIEFSNKSSFNNKPRFILINNIELLNINSANALLKVLEEPNEGIFFILIHNNSKKIQDTINSRCINFKLNLNFNESNKISSTLINNEIHNEFNEDFINNYNTPGFYLKLLDFANTNKIDIKNISLKEFLLFIIDNNLFKKNLYVKKNFSIFFELYFLKLISQRSNQDYILRFYSKFINDLNDCYKFNLDYETLFLEFKSKVLNG